MPIDNAGTTYEVLTGAGDRWLIDSIHDGKTLAMARAKALLSSNKHDAVRVTREVPGFKETVIFQQECTPRAEKPIIISAIEQAYICTDLVDLTRYEARKTAGRVLRRYLDEYNLTALEVLHNYDHLRELQRVDRLFDQAIHKVASVQARTMAEDAKTRIDLLYRLSTQLIDWTRDTRDTARYLTAIKKEGLTAALQLIDSSLTDEARSFQICAVLAAYTGQAKDWQAKLKLIFEQLEMQEDEEAVRYLDETVAEIMDGSNAVREILGPQPDLATALRAMAKLSTAKYVSKGRGDSLLVRFNKIMARHAMPVTRDILRERIARSVSGTVSLTREDDETDKAAFPPLVKDLITHAGLFGGAAMSEAFTRRARIVMKTNDNDLSPDEGITCILAMLPNRAVGIGYLLDLSRSEFGQKHQAVVLTKLLETVKPIETLQELLPPNSSRDKLARAVDDLRHRVGDDQLGQEIEALIESRLGSIFGDEATPKKKADKTSSTMSPKSSKATRSYVAGDVIFKEDEPGDEAFAIISGEIQISIGMGDRKAIIATLGRGEIFGEMALVDDQPRMATATAIKDASLYVVPQEAFKKRLSWLSEEDRLISHIIETLVSRLRDQVVYAGNS